jgi:hypothetical protein
MVEDFAVISDPERGIFIAHGLVPAGKVHDTKAPVPEKGVAVIEVPNVVWSAMADGVCHSLKDSLTVGK